MFTFLLKTLWWGYNYVTMKYKKTTIFFLLFSVVYAFFFFQAEKMQTLSTFPWIQANIQDVVGYEEESLDFEEINVTSTSWENINGLYLSGTKNEMVYYFHGNGWPLPYFYSEIKYIHDLWYGVFAFDYPGYGKSSWTPEIEKVWEFSKDFFEYIKKEKNIQNEYLIVWGYSVGTAVAVEFAAKNDFSKIVLVSPFASRYDMWKRWFFNIPPQKLFFMENSYMTSQTVQQFSKPVLILHGNNDFIVPFSQGKQVFENYAGEKSFIEIDDFWHNGIIDEYGEVLKNIFSTFLSWEMLDFQYMILNQEKIQLLQQENEQKEQELSFLSQDFWADDSIIKYVSREISFDKLNYEPSDLVSISGENIDDVKWNQRLRKEAKIYLDTLAKEFHKTFWVPLKVISAYRNYGYQVGIKSWGCNDIFCAKAGYSEHQTALAIDIFETTSEKIFLQKPDLQKYFTWMQENAYKYGFHNSYQKGTQIDGYEVEPWHWRYIWVPFATYLREHDMTLAQFYTTYILKK